MESRALRLALTVTQRLLNLVNRDARLVDDDHDRAFVARYEMLRRYAPRLVGQEHLLADDLIQDAYVQFTLTRPGLEEIQNLDAYLVTLVRNLHISSTRRAAAHRSRQVEVQDYESAALALTRSTAEDQVLVTAPLAIVGLGLAAYRRYPVAA